MARPSIPVLVTNLETLETLEFPSIRGAGRHLKSTHKNLIRSLYGVQGPVKNHRVEYKNLEDKKHNRKMQVLANKVIKRRELRKYIRDKKKEIENALNHEIDIRLEEIL